MVDDAIAGIERGLRDATARGVRVRVIRLEAGLYNAIRRSTTLRVVRDPRASRPRRPRLFGVDVVADETLAAGTWRLEH